MNIKGPSGGSKVGAGKSIINRHERFFHRGTLMFIEGESSAEMFIIRSGKVRILKQEGEASIELACLGPGSVLGELSLLDHQPRGATAQVLEDTAVTVIDEELFTRTLQSIPEWLGNMIQIVVKRLRDTMKKTGNDIVVKSIGGVVQIILLLTESKNSAASATGDVLVSTIKEQACAVIGLGGLELENVFLHLILKDLVLIRKNEQGREFVVIRDRGALRLYLQYLRMHQRGGTLIGESFSAGAFDLIGVLMETGQKSGALTSDKLMRINEQQIEIELARAGKARFIDRDALDELIAAKLLAAREDVALARHGHHEKKTYVFNPEILRSVEMLKKWLPVFQEEVRF